MNIPCPTKIDCLCTDNPFENLSSEGPDAPRYFSQRWIPVPERIVIDNPDWSSRACHSFCDSTVSQLEADECARLLAELCANDDQPLVGNDEITVTVTCP